MAKVLFADDSITVRKVAERLLTGAGLKVAVASSGEEALKMFDAECPDLVITDVIMPDKSGYDVCNYVRGHAALSGTPVLLISGVVTDDVKRQAESCRADGVLKKPFQGTILQDRVLELLDKQGPAKRAATPSPTSLRFSTKASDQAGARKAATVATEAGEETASIPPAPDAAPAMSKQPTGTEPIVLAAFGVEPVSSESRTYRITQEQLDTFRQAIGRIRELEADLAKERQRYEERHEMHEQTRSEGRRVAELEQLLSTERETSAEQRGLVQQGAARVEELETELKQAQEQLAAMAQQAEQSRADQGRVSELEQLLSTEREASAEQRGLVQQGAARVEELETELKRVQKQLATITRQAEQGRADQARVSELEQLLSTEREASAEQRKLVQQGAGRVEELEAELKRECERIAKMAMDAQQASDDKPRLQELERSLQEERKATAELRAKIEELKQAAGTSAKQVKELSGLLNIINQLAERTSSRSGNEPGKS